MAFTTPYENKTQLVGTSADTKPTGVDKYTLFLELDTLDIYYYGDDGWAKCGESGKQVVVLDNENVVFYMQA